MSCPDIETLLEAGESSREHARTCAACRAVLGLSEVRSSRLSQRESECGEAELWLALRAEGLLDSERSTTLERHLESCRDCGEVATRSLALTLEPVRRAASARSAKAWVAAAAVAGVALGAGYLLGRRAPSPTAVVAEADGFGRTSTAAGVAPCAPASSAPIVAPSVVPSVEPPPLAPSASATPRREVTRRGSELVDPWARESTSKPPEAAKGTGFLTLLCSPVCQSVRAGPKELGPSPIVRAPLPAGRVDLLLRSGSQSKRVSVVIQDQRTSALRVRMTAAEEIVDPFY